MPLASWTLIEASFNNDSIVGYEYEATILDGAVGDVLPVGPLPSGHVINITLSAGINTGKFQATSAPYNKVLTSTVPAEDWFDVTLTSTTGTVSDAIVVPISGLRGVSLAGTIKIQVRL